MKKFLTIAAALALVLGLSQCRKPNAPTINGGNGETIVQQATVGATCNGGNSKVDGQIIGNALKLTWEQPDVIEVGIPDKSDKSTLTLSGPAGETSGKFTGTITGQTGDKLTFFYKAANSEIYLDNEGYVTTDVAQFMNQNGKLEKTEDNKASVKNSILDRLCAYAQNIDFISSSAAEYDVDLEVPYAILKLDLSYFGTAAGNKVSIMIGNYEVASVTGVTNEANHPYYVAMSAADSYEYTFSGNGKTAKVTWKLNKNTYYTKTDGDGGSTGEAIVVAPQAPKFSVSATKTVEFSKGNLWYGTASSKDAAAFHFETNQWDFLPTANGTWNSNHVSHFHWCKSSAEAVKQDYEETGTTVSDVFFTNTSETEGTFTVDGVPGWRTLSEAEWSYLLNSRTPATTSANFKELTISGTSNTVSGLVLLPNGSGADLSTITDTDHLAVHGAVFLPAAGVRYGTDVDYVGSNGLYWSSTPQEDNENRAYNMYFASDYVDTDSSDRLGGNAVRLVR